MPTIVLRNFKTKQGGTCQPGQVLAVGGALELLIGKQALEESVTSLTIIRRADVEDGHWEMFLECNGVTVKIDLMEVGYRILYGAELPPKNAEVDVTATKNATLRQMINSLLKVSTQKGDWTGTAQYNCQDFVVEFLKQLASDRVIVSKPQQVSKSLKYELIRYVRKNKGPQYWMDVGRLHAEYGVPMFNAAAGPAKIMGNIPRTDD